MQGNTHFNVRKLVLVALFSALVTVFTMMPSIPVGKGYVHLGDGVIFASAFVLGPWAAVVGGFGSVLSDLMLGYQIYAPATLIIKALMGLVAAILIAHGGKYQFLRNMIAFTLAEMVMLAGYFAYEYWAMGMAVAMSGFWGNLIQAGSGVIVGMVVSPVLSRLYAKTSDFHHNAK